MNFELTLSSCLTNEKHFSYKLAFLPSPVWIKGDKKIKANCSGPHYEKGEIKILLSNQKINQYFETSDKFASIIVNQHGIGADLDLKILLDDLSKEGFKIKLYQ